MGLGCDREHLDIPCHTRLPDKQESIKGICVVEGSYIDGKADAYESSLREFKRIFNVKEE